MTLDIARSGGNVDRLRAAVVDFRMLNPAEQTSVIGQIPL